MIDIFEAPWYHLKVAIFFVLKCDSSTVGSTPPCQGGGRGFESRLSLSLM